MKSTSLLLLALLAGGCQPERTPEAKEAPPSFESARFQLVVVDQAGGDAHGLWKLDNRSGQTWRFVASGWVEVKDATAVASPAISDSETLRPLTGEETE